MTWKKIYPYQGETLLAEITRVTTVTPDSIIAPSTVVQLLNAEVNIRNGESNVVLAEFLLERARVSPVFRSVLLATAEALTPEVATTTS